MLYARVIVHLLIRDASARCSRAAVRKPSHVHGTTQRKYSISPRMSTAGAHNPPRGWSVHVQKADRCGKGTYYTYTLHEAAVTITFPLPQSGTAHPRRSPAHHAHHGTVRNCTRYAAPDLAVGVRTPMRPAVDFVKMLLESMKPICNKLRGASISRLKKA